MIIHDEPQPRDLQEQIADMEADNLAMAAPSRLFKQDELEDYELAIGKRYAVRDFLFLLSKCAPSLLIRDGLEGSVAIYRPLRRDEARNGDSRKLQWYQDHIYVSGFPASGFLNEYSSLTTDTFGRPHREDRGWRTVLISLIKARCVTYSQVKQIFGEPTHSRGWRWHNELREYR